MTWERSTKQNLLVLGGIAGIFVGIFVLSFAFLASSIGIAFVPEVFSGGSIDYWIENVRANPGLSMYSVISIFIGFGAMFVSGFVLFQLIEGKYWQKYLALSGYIIGIPVAIYNFLERLSLQYQIIQLPEEKLSDAVVNFPIRLSLQEWHFTAEYICPFFIVILGTGFMAWAAKKDRLLPNWLCYWAFLCGLLTLVFYFTRIALAGLGAGPLHMLWFFVMGIVLLRKKYSIKNMEEGTPQAI